MRRQGMLTQGLIPDPKCELNITPSLTFPHLTLPHLCQGYHDHCIVTSSDGGMGRLGGGSCMVGFVWGYKGWVSYSVFVLLLIVLS